MSYQRALREFNKKATQRSDEFAALHDNPEVRSGINEYDSEIIEEVENNEDEESLSVAVQPEPIIQPSTKYILEIYDRHEGMLNQMEQNPPGDIVGLSRDEVEKYLDEYMRDLPLSEYNKGLLSYELLSFSDKQVKFRKSYDAEMVPYRFYVVVKTGMLLFIIVI